MPDEDGVSPEQMQTPEDARRQAARTIAWFSEGANEQVGVGALDQHIGQWRTELARVGLDLTDRETLWAAAVMTDRLLFMILTDSSTCPMGEHIVHHIRSGATPLLLALNSAIETYGGLEAE